MLELHFVGSFGRYSSRHKSCVGSNQPSGLADGSADGATGCRSTADCPEPGPSNVGWVCLLPYATCHCGPVVSANEGVACTENSQCGAGLVCRATTVSDGGFSSSGLMCVPAVACTDDSQCGVGQVCREDLTVPLGLLGPTGLVCSPPCSSDLDCIGTNKCESGGHCQARTCAECPSYLSCTSGSCVVPSCSTDTDCSGGYCVAGRCAGSLGICRLFCL
jgi:Cys-rich repeat protein